MPSSWIHDPDAILDYYIDWRPWLAGDVLSESTWVSDTDDVTLSDEAIVGGFTCIWVAVAVDVGGVGLTNHIVTAAGREDDRTIYLTIQER